MNSQVTLEQRKKGIDQLRIALWQNITRPTPFAKAQEKDNTSDHSKLLGKS